MSRRHARFALLGSIFAAGCDGDAVEGAAPDRGATLARQSRLYSGNAAMLFDGPSCTAEKSAAGDRWCAFVARAASGSRSLFVANVSLAQAGVSVSCGVDDPNCLELTPALGGDSFDPTWHGTRFWGDTLIYYDDAFVPYAWRPGMGRGRVLVETSADLDAIFCSGSVLQGSVACLGVPAEQGDVSLLRATLLLGTADAAEEPLLGSVGQVIAANTRDQGVPRFGYGFPPVPGAPLAWTTRDSADGPELLRLAWPGGSQAVHVVASDVHAWDVSPDGQHWFWLRAVDADGAGTLEIAPFPGGAPALGIQPQVVVHRSAASGERRLTLSATGTLAALDAPRRADVAPRVLDEGVQSLLSSSAREHVAYTKNVGNWLVDLFLANAGDGSVCALDTTISVPVASFHFSPAADAAVWARAKAGGFDGFHIRLADCHVTALAPDVMALAWVHGAVLFMDSYDTEAQNGTMRLLSAASGELYDTDMPTSIAEHVDTYAIADSPPGALIYTVNAGGGADGVYVASFGARAP